MTEQRDDRFFCQLEAIETLIWLSAAVGARTPLRPRSGLVVCFAARHPPK